MNSRGTLIRYLINGDTLPSSDTVAMTPTVHPAAAGTQRYREFDRPRGPRRGPERGPELGPGLGVASVTDREDMPSIREMLAEAPGVADTSLHMFCGPGWPVAARPSGRSAKRHLKAAKLAPATIPANARNS
ncbi:hypothetical protein MMAN_08860 [Mycobacterium mantenii]|uniref:Uncharacterized protein n=1 Tax=Mycobacterium mantenii TaxID=560555 RepID=A0ABN6A5A9_MYCNT|nr:hypothetical protein MMAN_08860 [Mycobacterium mantenii]